LAQRRAIALDHVPRLALADRRTFLDPHHVARLALVGLVMRRVFLRATNELLVQRVHDSTFDTDRHGLVHLVARHSPRQDAPRHRAGLLTISRRSASAPPGWFSRARSRAAPGAPARCSPAARWHAGSAD